MFRAGQAVDGILQPKAGKADQFHGDDGNRSRFPGGCGGNLKVYNETREFVFQLEKDGRAVVVAPEKPVGLSRFEKDVDKLRALYEKGMADAGKVLGSCGWLEVPPAERD